MATLVVENEMKRPITVNLSEYDKKTGRMLIERSLILQPGTNNEPGTHFSKDLWELAKKRPYIQDLLDNRKLVEQIGE